MKTINEVGNKYGRLTVISRNGSDAKGSALWLCRCDCGAEKVIRGTDLRTGHTKSCGCLEHENRVHNGYKRMKPTHGMSKTRLYEVWSGMKGGAITRSTRISKITALVEFQSALNGIKISTHSQSGQNHMAITKMRRRANAL